MEKVVLKSRFGVEVRYSLDQIACISYDYAMDLYDEDELAANDVKKGTVIMVIDFVTGGRATYQARNWIMRFE